MSSGIQKLLLLGAGHAHVQVLAQLAQHRPADLDVTVLTPYPFQTYSGMVPGLIAGRYSPQDCQIPLEPLFKAAGARWVQGRVTALDAAAQTVQVAAAGGNKNAPEQLPYTRLSIDTGAIIDRHKLESTIPSAAARALIVRPIEAFAALWPQVLDLAQKQAVSLAVIGAGAAGLELVFAVEQRLRGACPAGASFTLITGGEEPAAHYPQGMRQRVLRRLKVRGITVLREACTGVDKGAVHLSNGASLACDVPILAIGTDAPVWLQGSGLALADSGHLLVNACQQSTSHPNVFAAGDVATRADAPHAKSGVYAVRAGPALAHNLMAAHNSQPLKPWRPPQRTLNLLSCGAGHAIASWGPLHAEGGWVWHWKDRIDRAFMARYCRPPTAVPR